MNISVSQFQPKDGAKTYNLSVIRKLAKKAKSNGADLINFYEMSVTAYTFTKELSIEQITDLAEEVPNGKSTQELIEISKELDIPILAGLWKNMEIKLQYLYLHYWRWTGREVSKKAALQSFETAGVAQCKAGYVWF
jgi:predicted amidohydrolase